jgi:protein-L-isoaspartate O-methyltransferase
LLAQLSDTGFLLGPVIRADGRQEVVRLTRRGGKVEIERLIPCTFVPLVRDVRRRSRSKPAGISQS